jgi:hypothetical protein
VPGLDRPVHREWLHDHALGSVLGTTRMRELKDLKEQDWGQECGDEVCDQHHNATTLAWLERHAPRSWKSGGGRATYLQVIDDAILDDRQSWDAKSGGMIPTMDMPPPAGPTTSTTSEWHLRFYRALRRYGAVKLRGAPTDADEAVQQAALEPVLPLFESDYGHVWVTQVSAVGVVRRRAGGMGGEGGGGGIPNTSYTCQPPPTHAHTSPPLPPSGLRCCGRGPQVDGQEHLVACLPRRGQRAATPGAAHGLVVLVVPGRRHLLSHGTSRLHRGR